MKIAHGKKVILKITYGHRVTYLNETISRVREFVFEIRGYGNFGLNSNGKWIQNNYIQVLEPTQQLLLRIKNEKLRVKLTGNLTRCDFSGVDVDRLQKAWDILKPININGEES